MLIFGQRICDSSWLNTKPTTTTTIPSQPPVRPAPAGLPCADLSQERIKRRPVLGGLINEYVAGREEAQVRAGGRVPEPQTQV